MDEQEAVATKTPEGTSRQFSVPDGYVLIEKAMYDFLMERTKSGESKSQDLGGIQDPEVYLRVLRAFHLGDIKTQINPDEEIAWVPKKSIMIRGKVSNQLGSFLSIWNKQDPNSPRYDLNFDPVFEVRNQETLDLYFKKDQTKVLPRERTVAQATRIEKEEKADAAHYPADLGLPGLNAKMTPQPSNQLPPRGSQERREMIRKMGNGEETRVSPEGIEMAQESTKSLPVTVSSGDRTVVAKIPGPPAEAQEVTAAQLKRKARRA